MLLKTIRKLLGRETRPDFASPGQPPSQPEVLLYTRAACHLCDEVKKQLKELQRQEPFTIAEVDIDSDAALQLRFNDEVPVIFIHGHKAFKHRLEPRIFLKSLRAGRTE